VGAAVLLAWGAGLMWLVQRRGDPTSAASGSTRSARPTVARVSPAAAYYRLSIGDSTVGFALLTLDTTTTAVEMVEQVDMRIPDGDSVRHVFQRTRSTFGRRLDFVGVDVMRREGPARWEVGGRAMGDSSFAWFLAEGTQRQGDTVATGGRALAPGAALPLALLRRGRPPRVGDVRTVFVADPVQRRLVPVEVTIAGDSTAIIPDSAARDPATGRWQPARWDTLRIWRLVRRGAGPPLNSWVDEDGLPVLGDIIPGVRADRLPFEVATEAYRTAIDRRFAGLGGRAGAYVATAPPRPLAVARVLLQQVGRDSAGWARSAVTGGRQRLRGDTLEVQRAAPPEVEGDPNGAPAALAVPDTFTVVAERLVGSERDPRRRAAQLARWTRTTILAGPDFGPTDPLRALRQRRGGASDRAAVLVALARAAGLEARPVAGLVAVSGGGWARHAWVEIHLDGWVPADPTFGTFPAGAGYMRLLQDVPADPLYLVPLAAWLDPHRLPASAQ